MVDKQTILQNIQSDLNQPDRPWEVTIQENSIVATWKWMDATFFSPSNITNKVKEYKFIVTLLDNCKWSEKDISHQDKTQINGGGLSSSKSIFIGSQTQKSFSIGFGKDNNTDKVGIIKNKFDTNEIKKVIRDYLTKCGWKKKGFFG